MLTPKETGSQGGIYPVDIPYSVLCKYGYGQTPDVAESATIALGFKPTAVDTAYPLCDPTSHYLLTIRKVGTTVTVWKQDVNIGSYTSTATNYASLVGEALEQYSGAYIGYLSRLVIVEEALNYASFYTQSGKVPGLWVMRMLPGLSIHTLLDFANAANLGADSSGNGHNWTFVDSVQSVDTPTNNFATLNPLGITSVEAALSNGMLSVTGSGAGAPWGCGVATMGTEFPTYFEVRLGAISAQEYTVAGVIMNPGETSSYAYPGETANSWGIQSLSGSLRVYNDASPVTIGSWGATYTGDVYGLAIDPVVGKVWVRKNDAAWMGGGDPVAGTSPTFTIAPGIAFPAVGMLDNVGESTIDFGQNGYAYAPPQGFLPLCDASRPEPAVLNVDEHYFGATFVAPVGAAQDIVVGWDAEASGFGLRLKRTDAAENWHYISDVAGLGYEVQQGSAGSINARTALATAVVVSGNTITVPADLLTSGGTYLVEVFRRGVESGFNVVTYTGDGVAGLQVPHGLGTAPFFVMAISNDASGRYKPVWDRRLSETSAAAFFSANINSASNASSDIWNATAPDSANVTVGTNAGTNVSGASYALWCWSDVGVYREVGFLGNGSSNGPFNTMGGTPLAFPIWKDCNALYGVVSVHDIMTPYNPIDKCLVVSDRISELAVTPALARSSVGYKAISNSTGWNASNHLIVGIAVAGNNKYRNAF